MTPTPPIPRDPLPPSAPWTPALSRWIDGEASAEEARDVEARLAADPALRATVERWRADAALARADAARAPADDLADRVLAAVGRGDPEAAEDDRFRRAARRTAAAAAVLLAAGVGGTIAVHRPPEAAAPVPGPSALTSLVESRRLALEVTLALDEHRVPSR